MGFLGEWTNGSNQVPDILRTGDFDAGPVAAGIFDNNIAGWAGTFLFTNLGDPHHYQTHAIDKLNSPYDLTTGAHDLGSYDIVSIAQGVQDYTSSSIAVAYQTLANLCAVFHTHSDLASYQAIIDATKAQADAAFKTAYGLTAVADPAITIGSDTLGVGNVATNIGKSAHYAVGTNQDDVIGTASSANGSYIVAYDVLPSLGLPTNNVVNAGRGNDTVFSPAYAGSNVLDGNEGSDTLSYAMGGLLATTTLNVRFDGFGNFYNRVVVDKDFTFASDQRDVAVNFEKLRFDFNMMQNSSGEYAGGSNRAVVEIDISEAGEKQNSELIRSETVEVIGSLANMWLSASINIDGGKEADGAILDPTLGDVLDFSVRSDAIAVKNANDGSEAIELFDRASGSASGIRFQNFEYVKGTGYNDVLNLEKLSPGGKPSTEAPEELAARGENLSEQAQIDAAWAAFEAAMPPGAYVDRTAYYAAKSELAQALLATRPYQSTLLVEAGDGVDIVKGSATGVVTIKGGAGTDYLEGGNGFSILEGGSGSDWLLGGGLETHMDGGADSDIFDLADGVFVQNGGTDDFVMLAGIRLTGGVQQWWMENGYAYFASTTSVVSASLGIFGFTNVLGVAALLFDTLTMKIARYAMSSSGQLVIEFAGGRAGQAVIEDYKPINDAGESTAGVTVFRQMIVEGKGSLQDLREYVKAAVAAGWGINIFATDPLVLDLDGDGLELIRQRDGVYFDLDNDNFAENTAWVRPDDGFLVRDLNGNGTIDNITEMFGNATTSGFVHLAALDSNADGKIDALDSDFASLKIWRDLDSDGVTDTGELQTLADANIAEISLTTTTLQGINRGSAIRAEATFTRTDNTTSKIFDVALEVDETDTKYLGNSTVSSAAALLPELRGYGNVTNLRIAMTNDATLLTFVTNFANMATTSTWQQIKDATDDILFRWAGVDAVTATAMGGGTFDRQKLAFLETYFGYQLTPRDGAGVPAEANITELIKSWNDVLEKESLRLALQGPLQTVFSGLTYDAVKDRVIAESPTAVADTIETAILQLSSTTSTALTQWNTIWAPMLAEVFQSTDRSDGIGVKTDYAIQSLIKAIDGNTPALTLQQFVEGLGLQGVKLGTVGADSLTRGDATGLQVYVGGSGNDTLTGGIGQDVYVFGTGFGQDTINDIEYVENGDRIRFATLTANDVTMTRVGLDLVISVKNSTDKITIRDQFTTPEASFDGLQISPNFGVEEIQFADGKIFEAGDIAAAVGLGTAGNDILIGTGTADELEGLAGDDILRGGDNGDTYYFSRGYGHDTIDDVMTSPLLNAGDALVFVNGISARDVAITRVGASDDVTLTLKNSPTDKVTILGQFAYDPLGYVNIAPNQRMEAIIFSMGASWNFTRLQQETIATYTTSGNDITYGFGTADDFFASAGNDLLVGFDGGDIYRFGKGAGQDTIHDQSRYPEGFFFNLLGVDWSTGDSVQFAAGLTAADITFGRLGAAPDLTISINGTTDTLTIKDQFKGEKLDLFGFIPVTWFSRIENFKFADGTVLTWEQILNQLTTGTAGNDELYGAYYRDTIDGKAGTDYLSGGDDGDTYVFGLGYGQDTIEDNQEGILTTTADKLKFGAGITVANTIFSRDQLNPLDLKIAIAGTSDTVLLKNQFDYMETGPFGTHFLDQIELFEWADGTIKSLATIVQEILDAAKTSGADSLYGTYGSETLDGGAGNDYLDGGAGSDVYLIDRGNGNDVIHETNYAHFTDDIDTVRFGTGILPTDIALSRYGTNLLGLTATINAGGGSVSIDDQFKFHFIGPNRSEVERFEFANGTVWTANDIRLTYLALMKTSGADTITGFATDDVIDGGAGDDLLNGINGSDTYLVGTGTGHDRITETTLEYTEASDTDTVSFESGIAASDVAFSRVGDDLVLKWNGANDSITVTNQFAATGTAGSSWTDIEQFTFADGTKLNAADAANRVIAALASSGADVINGSMYGETFDGLAGNDTLRGDGGGDTYVFKLGMGQDIIEESVPDVYLNQPDVVQFEVGIAPASVTFERVGNDLVASIVSGEQVTIKNQFTNPYAKVEFFKFADGTVISAVQAETGATTAQATAGADTIIGTIGDDIIDGGAGNDLIKGGNGNDTIVFGRGSGQDIVNDNDEYPYQTSWNDKISFTADVKPADVELARSGADLIITIAGSSDQLTIVGQFTTTKQNFDNHDRIETFVFADGTVWTAGEIDQRLITLATTSGADTIIGYDSDDTFLESAGNDVLKGGYGNDTYHFGRGSGQDVINDNDVYHYSTSWLDKLVFGVNIKAADLVLSRSGNDLVIAIAGTSDSIIIQGQFTTTKQTIDNHDRIETFLFDDGSSLSAQEIDLLLLNQAATAGSDTIVGYDSDDTFIISAGNDLMKGGYGNDSYAFGRGSGQDTIDDNDVYHLSSSWADRVVFGADVLPSDIVISRSGHDLIFAISGTTDQLTIKGQAFTTQQSTDNIDRIETFHFSNGTIWSASEIDVRLLQQSKTAGNDTIVGFDSADTLDGGAGTDILKGGYGNDTYIFDRGYGHDTIDDNDVYAYQTSLADRVLFKTGLSAGDLRFARSADDLVISIAGTSDQLTIKNQFLDVLSSANNYDRIENFAFSDGSMIMASEIDRAVLIEMSTGGDDTITGYNSNDAMDGGLGNDTLYGGLGNDTLKGGYGNDTMDGGAGDDTYVYSRGDGDDAVFEGAFNGSGDRLLFTSINAEDVTLVRDGADVTIQVAESAPGAGDGGSILLKDTLDNSYGRGVDSVVFADGTVWDRSDLLQETMQGDITIWGTSGADTLYGTSGNDVFLGSTGNDNFYSSTGSDTFVYASGDGNDWIDEEGYSTSEVDVLRLVDLTADDLVVGRSGTHVLLTVGSTGHVITLDEQLYSQSAHYGIDRIDFADGASWHRSQIQEAAWIRGTNGNDVLWGSSGNDVFAGGLGDDTFYSSTGGDTFVYASGDGNDVIDEEGYSTSEVDVLRLTDLNATDIELSRSGTHVFLSVAATGHVIKLDEQLYSDVSNYGIDKIDFANGSSWNRTDIASNAWYRGTAGNDTLTGSNGNDVFQGKAGDDTLNSSLGSDTFVYASGDGNDVINEDGYSTSEIDVLGLTNIDSNEVTLSRSGVHVTFLITATGETITLDEQLYSDVYNYGIDRVDFADSVSWSRADIVANAWRLGTSNGDVITGAAGIDKIDGKGGNDTLSGAAGSDTLVGGAGDDTLAGGQDNDVFVFNVGFGHDVIADFATGTDVIRFDTAVFNSFAAVMAGSAQVGSDVVITYDSGNTVTLNNVTVSALQTSDFNFV